jgi:predicted alpha/beta hydrolase family esterase
MKKHVLINYAWNAERGETKWLFWLKKALEAKDIHVTISALSKDSQGTAWFQDIKNIYGITDDHVHFVEHDPGCLTILKYIEYLETQKVENTTLLVAGRPKKGTAGPYIALEGPKEIILSGNKQAVIDPDLTVFDTKIVVLYSANNEALESAKYPALERPVNRYNARRPNLLRDLKRAFGAR